MAVYPQDRSSSFLQKLSPWLWLLLLIAYTIHLVPHLAQGTTATADTFRYFWPGELTRYYFLSSSLTVRTLNLLLGNNFDYIGHVQLIIAFLPPVALYLGLRSRNPVFNIFLVLVLLVLYASAGPIRYFNIVSSDSLFLSLLLTFTVALYRGSYPGRWLVVALFGILFIFSRNAAPYIVLVQLALYVLLRFRDLGGPRMVAAILILLAASLTSLGIIRCCDTTKEINAVDNIYTHVFPYPEKVTYFRERYGMPVGPFLETCVKGTSSVNDPCIEHVAIYTGDSITRQYRVTQDDYGFSDWIRQKGMRSWQHYVLFANTAETLRTFIDAYGNYARHMFWQNENNPLKTFVFLGRFYDALGVFNTTALLLYVGLGFVVYFYLGKDTILETGLILILLSLPIFFIGLFGDAEETFRYTYPAVICLYLGFLFYLIGMARSIGQWLLFRTRAGPGQHQAQ